MRLLLIALGCAIAAAPLWAAPAQAAGADAPGCALAAPADPASAAVPTADCAYDALSRLAEQGILAGYPAGYFDGSRERTRGEFAQAVMAVLAAVGQPASAEAARTTADCLRREFADDIAALQQDSSCAAPAMP
jgi:hypothetical protein